MYLSHLRLRDFRNYSRLDLNLSPGFHLLLGNNAQGKTNVLEAIYLLATLRSFRGVGGAQMVRQGTKGFFVGASLVSSAQDEIKLYWSSAERKLSVNQQPVRRLVDYFGLLRVVVFCTEDLLLVKGVSSARRRFVDLLLAQTENGYLALLQRYARVVRSRNALLKTWPVDELALESFTRELLLLGNQLIKFRREFIPKLSVISRLAYRRIAAQPEEIRIEYKPSVKSDFALELKQARNRERSLKTTSVGPHRDDVEISIGDLSASKFASEGQKRSVVIALKMAQAEYLAGIHGSPPILLIDDVMGELDVARRSGFLPILERAEYSRSQVFMTCTEENWPRELSTRLQRWSVSRGRIVACGKSEA